MSKTRYQGAILQGTRILLVHHQEHQAGRGYWILPGGRIDPHETEEACVVREIKEETGLDVQVIKLLLDEPGVPGGVYTRLKTYLCQPTGGEAAPGYEPEADAASVYAIDQLAWFELDDEAGWAQFIQDPITPHQLRRIRTALDGL